MSKMPQRNWHQTAPIWWYNPIEDLYWKYKIKSYEEKFESKMKINRLKEIVEFIKEIGLELNP